MGDAPAKIQTLQKPAQLPGIDLNYLLPALRPNKHMLFQTLLPQAKSIAVPVQNLDHIAAAVAKNKQVAGKRVLLQTVLDQNRQPIDGFSHVRAAYCQIDSGVKR
jgi:hypothetical protein